MCEISPELKTYLLELKTHAENIVSELDEISALSKTTNLSKLLDFIRMAGNAINHQAL